MAGGTGAADAADGGFGEAADVCCEEADICGAAFPCGFGRRCFGAVSVDAGVCPFAPVLHGGGTGWSWACEAGGDLGTTARSLFERGASWNIGARRTTPKGGFEVTSARHDERAGT